MIALTELLPKIIARHWALIGNRGESASAGSPRGVAGFRDHKDACISQEASLNFSQDLIAQLSHQQHTVLLASDNPSPISFSAYSGKLIDWTKQSHDIELEVVIQNYQSVGGFPSFNEFAALR